MNDKYKDLKNKYPCVEANNPMDYVECALAIEILAYHNKNFLDRSLNSNKEISEQIQMLLKQALECEG